MVIYAMPEKYVKGSDIEKQRNHKSIKNIARHLIYGSIIDSRENFTLSKMQYESIRKQSMIKNQTREIRGRFN